MAIRNTAAHGIHPNILQEFLKRVEGESRCDVERDFVEMAQYALQEYLETHTIVHFSRALHIVGSLARTKETERMPDQKTGKAIALLIRKGFLELGCEKKEIVLHLAR